MVLRSPSFNPPLKPLANFDQTWQRWSPFRIISNDHTQPSKMATMTKNRKYWQNISSETTGPIGFKLWGNSPWMVPFQNFLSDHFADQPRWLPWRSIENSAKNQFKNHLWNYWTNCDQHLGDWFLDGPFQKCFWCPRLPTKKAVIFKSRKFGKKS